MKTGVRQLFSRSRRSEITRLNLIWIIPAKGLMRADFLLTLLLV